MTPRYSSPLRFASSSRARIRSLRNSLRGLTVAPVFSSVFKKSECIPARSLSTQVSFSCPGRAWYSSRPSLPMAILILFSGLIYVSSYYIDYTYMGYLIKAELIEGRDLQCIDLPEKYWRRIPKCQGVERPRDDKPSNEESLGEEFG